MPSCSCHPRGRVTVFQSTPSAWGATLLAMTDAGPAAVSIHALRVEGDLPSLRHIFCVKVSIHALRVEGDRASLS